VASWYFSSVIILSLIVSSLFGNKSGKRYIKLQNPSLLLEPMRTETFVNRLFSNMILGLRGKKVSSTVTTNGKKLNVKSSTLYSTALISSGFFSRKHSSVFSTCSRSYEHPSSSASLTDLKNNLMC
jgi:hypothetical protein